MQRRSGDCGQERKEWILWISWFLNSLMYAATRHSVGLLSHCICDSMLPCKEELLFLEKLSSLQPLSSLRSLSAYFSKLTLHFKCYNLFVNSSIFPFFTCVIILIPLETSILPTIEISPQIPFLVKYFSWSLSGPGCSKQSFQYGVVFPN